MEDPRRPPVGNAPPGADATAAGAFAPPPGSGRSVTAFVAALVAVVCGVAGVLLFFTGLPAWYGVLVLAVASVAAVVWVGALRRSRR
ncbi:hypothetical protein [Blastococcus capsensis]|uniref:hypothetical protein n=1 Tax=Blastococcus capsensis TaxID=1564163 RepID=UPI0025418B9C|nr:hypothetical protein [Blastococcus capsensis]MDK3258567.1 hypothetical protein [Blastococcus capsensis]